MSVSHTSIGESARAVVFLHGVGSGKEGWMAQADAVTRAGWRFIAFDAPGFGQTPLPQQAGFEPHMRAVIDILDHYKLENAVICGHSLGGMTAQEVYAAHPDRVSALILSATSPAFGKPDGDFQKEFLRARFEPFDNGMTMPEFARSFAPKLLGSSPDSAAVENVVEVMSRVSVEAYRLAMQTITGFDQRSNLPNITVPTLLIAGDHDTNSPAKMMARMAQHIANSIYVELENTGHMAPIENAPAFNHHLTSFLQRLD